jgi:catechol 2,3-dioxygenase-like lactoylglutathione lyase family enzyme
MITGSHVVIFTKDAEADRAFFRDVLQMPAVDAGGGWLVFALPPSEVAFHPAGDNDRHELYLLCDDLQATMAELEGHGTTCDEPVEESWGIVSRFQLPGGGRVGLYEPKHPLAVTPSGEK